MEIGVFGIRCILGSVHSLSGQLPSLGRPLTAPETCALAYHNSRHNVKLGRTLRYFVEVSRRKTSDT
jgi:hypothetical protein